MAALISFALLLTFLLLAGCSAAPELMRPVPIQRHFTECPRPARPELRHLDEGLHLADPANVGRLLEIVEGLFFYGSGQDAALDCYEKQAGENE
ncbi:hypothetical protein LJC36_00170 [Desulfovibrio sp. OttesenSCG-928-C14]|nr:hypothetical protein [Desulfovibrio sp. OttesenSCG-928-C14]